MNLERSVIAELTYRVIKLTPEMNISPTFQFFANDNSCDLQIKVVTEFSGISLEKMKAFIVSSLFLLVLVVCITGIKADSEDIFNRNKRWLFDRCSADNDCGADRCCVKYLKVCAAKRALNKSCNLVNLHGCGCQDHLECRVYKSLGSLKFYRCLEPEGSGDL